MASSTVQPSSPSSADRLLRKLQNYETTIIELISLKRSTVILKEKLLELDELILDIPNEHDAMATEWRIKLAGWWKNYAAYSTTETTSRKLVSQSVQTAATTSEHHHQDEKKLNHPEASGPMSAPAFPLGATSSQQYNPAANAFIPINSPGPVGQLPPGRSNFVLESKPIGSQLTQDHQVHSWPPVVGSPTTLTYAQVSALNHRSSGASSNGSENEAQGAIGHLPTLNTVTGCPRFGASPTLPCFPDTNCYNAFTGPITKSSIFAQLKTAFDQLTIARDDSAVVSGGVLYGPPNAYIDGMQKLLAAVAKAIKVLIPFVVDDQLMMDVASIAIGKMPPEKQTEFNDRYERRSLFSLMRFLRKEIVLYYEKFNAAGGDPSAAVGQIHVQQQQPISSTATSASSNVEDALPYCVYCRHEGHRVHECPIKRGMLCFKCYEFGHTLKCCPNTTLFSLK